MKGEVPALIVLPRISEERAPSSRRSRPERAPPPSLTGPEQVLFERLRACRAEIAKESGVPAYVVAHDRTLIEIAKKKPQSRARLLDVHGMGPARVEQYGERLLRVLTSTSPSA